MTGAGKRTIHSIDKTCQLMKALRDRGELLDEVPDRVMRAANVAEVRLHSDERIDL